MDTKDSSNIPTISVVIPTLNEEDEIQECLNSIYSSNYPKEKIEIIISDTGSTDKTINIAKKNNVKVLELKPKQPSAAFGLYHGLKNASGDYIQYLAADSLLNKDWLANAISEFKNQKTSENIGVVGGFTRELRPEDSLFSFFLSIGLRAGESVYGDVLYNAGSGLIRKEVVGKTNGGFNYSLVSEDEVDFGIKVNIAGYIYRKIPKVMIFHKLGLKNNLASLKKMLKRHWRQGIGLGQINELHKGSDYIKKYMSQMTLYKLAALFPLILFTTLIFLLFFPVIGLIGFELGLGTLLILPFSLSKKFKVDYFSTLILSIWYLCTIWIIFSGYLFFIIMKPNKYKPYVSS